MTAIAVPIFVKSGVDLEDAIAQAEEALEGQSGLIELRCDTASEKQMLEAIDLAQVPVIVTIRPTWEGGFGTRPDPQRIELWEAAIDAGADYLDVELAAWEKSARIRDALEDTIEKAGTRLIISNHHFEGRPKDLEQRLTRLGAVKAAHTLKIAWKAESVRDALDALVLTRDRIANDCRPVVALAMGEEGLLSRVLAKKFNAPFTFATVARGKESAPGQPTVDELVTRYRWATQQKDTPVFGVAGFPVGHSLSPHIHNAALAHAKVPGVYVPLAIQPGYEIFSQTVDSLRSALDLRGLSVTIPHKENAFRYAAERSAVIDPLARTLGVINTLVWKSDGSLTALNSDYFGALDALVSAWTGQRSDVAGKRIAVIGAGGAARAIASALAAHGATVVVYNRTREKADQLVVEIAAQNLPGKVVAADWSKLCESCCEAYINCTPLGMHPGVDASPIDFDPGWNADTVVFDTVYNPPRTRLLKLAEKKGAKTVAGTEMFLRQAVVQFGAFTGRKPDIETFRAALKT